jgi:hypothetical protein
MTRDVLDIVDRENNPIPMFDSTKYFTLGPVRSQPSDVVLDDPGWTLFCF